MTSELKFTLYHLSMISAWINLCYSARKKNKKQIPPVFWFKRVYIKKITSCCIAYQTPCIKKGLSCSYVPLRGGGSLTLSLFLHSLSFSLLPSFGLTFFTYFSVCFLSFSFLGSRTLFPSSFLSLSLSFSLSIFLSLSLSLSLSDTHSFFFFFK